MTRLIFAAAIVALAAPIQAQEENPATAQPEKQVVTAQGDAASAAIIADCSTRKFETTVEFEKDGEKRRTKMKLCAAKGEDEATWVKTLEDAKAKIAAHPNISAESKAKIAAELDFEIARNKPSATAANLLPDAPIEAAPPKPAYGSAPPLPAPKAVAAKPNLAAAPLPPSVPKPRLTVKCLESGERGEGSTCFSLLRSTRLAIKADENLGGDTSLRFLRKGDIRGEIALAGMRKGQLIRHGLPSELCTVISSQVEIQVVRSNQVFDRLGPYKLRC